MSWRRRSLSALRLAGLRVIDLGSTGQLISRSRDPAVVPLDAGVHAISTEKEIVSQPLAANAWLVQVRKRARRLIARQLGPQTWAVGLRGANGPHIRRLGPESAQTHLVYDRESMQSRIRLMQQGLSNFVAGEHAAWILRELEVNCVLDVGANTGQYAQALRAAGYRGRIVSYEPLPHLVAELERSAVDDPDWVIVPVALGEQDGEAEINMVPGTMSSLLPSSEFGKSWAPVLGEMTPQKIDVRRLDSILDEAVSGIESPRIYLKMDTQGYDVATFRGAGNRVAELVGMQSEVACVPIYDGMPKMMDQVQIYEGAGFALSGMFPITIDRRTLRVIEFDAMFVRVEALNDRERH